MARSVGNDCMFNLVLNALGLEVSNGDMHFEIFGNAVHDALKELEGKCEIRRRPPFAERLD